MIGQDEIARTYMTVQLVTLDPESGGFGSDDWLLAIALEADAANDTWEQASLDAGLGSFGPM